METTVKRRFESASGICESGYVIATITKFENPAWITITGSVGNDPFVFGAGPTTSARGMQSVAVQKTLDALYERHPLSRDEIDAAISDALSNLLAR